MFELQKSMERLVKEQRKDGLFPTYREDNTHNLAKEMNQETAPQIDNIGIHAYILDKLVYLGKGSIDVDVAFGYGLSRIVEDAIDYNGDYLWRWLKKTDRKDYVYPPDHDDTAKAVEVIEQARIHYPTVFNGLRNKYEKIMGQDYTKLLSDDLANGVYTFIRNRGFKDHNEIDFVVNSNVLNAYLNFLRNKKAPNDEIVFRIRDFLSGFILSEQFNANFEEISRFYLTTNLMSNIISDINLTEPKLFDNKVIQKIIYKADSSLADSPNVLETAMATGTLLKLGFSGENVKRGIDEIIDRCEDDAWPAYAFFHHKRLNHVFGSKALTSAYCLEALKLGGVLR